MKFHLAIDSGAFSVFNKHVSVSYGVRGNVSVRAHFDGKMNLGYLRTKHFRDYLDGYVKYVTENRSRMDFCVGMDIIFDAKASYELWDELDKQGVKTMPVIHFGEDLAFLKKYMDRTDYLGIGGLGHISKGRYHKWGKEVFKLLVDKKGRPKWRTHGFAMSSFDLMEMYPWHSVDSTSPFSLSRYGKLCVPKYVVKGKIHNFDDAAGIVSITERRTWSSDSYLNAGPLWKAHVDAYLAGLGFTAEQVAEGYAKRDACNVLFYSRTAQQIAKGRDLDLKLYVSGKPGSGEPAFVKSLPFLEKHGIPDLFYSGSYYLPSPTNYFLAQGMHNGRTTGRPTMKERATA